ncbi:hypothetical protein C7M61_001026 [Candidozyma pseudohaemuli]|uniref:Uncharacterized protein n=1 Tax=Candidozyma pseudohaemuli TaxID=418784 RepID=A0A2P7YZF4_9ASCO|nr:hypothetical protein C7M61_001026 [[Candida] pseudohaemulonii]PSK41344.1 hypothetical protein C7M61_001026 [[Candida] pseudohaemulonii]
MTLSYTNSIRTKLGDLLLESEERSSDHSSRLSAAIAQKNQEDRGIPISRLPGQEFLGLTDEHPEPELLATSVGKDSDGRLLPSSLTILLLSLNANNLGSIGQLPHIVDRRNSHGPALRNSLTHLHHQRLQPYHKLTQVGQESNTQSIPMVRNAAGMLSAPDLPNLDPTSLGSLPSRFWLGSQTPPKSLSGSYKRSCLQFTQLHPHNAQLHNAQAGRRTNRGDELPTLPPVQTPMEDMPMTPLHLNLEADSYFVYGQRRDVFQYDEDPENQLELDEMEN